MWSDKDLFKDYYVTTYREGKAGDYYIRWYLRIMRRQSDDRSMHTPVTTFRIESEFPPVHALGILIKYQGQWDTWASLIVEYVVNELKINDIYLDDVYDGY